MCPDITIIDTTMNGNITAILPTGQILHDITNVICHSISTNRPSPIWMHNSNYKGVI
jgi:hypothetical protein